MLFCFFGRRHTLNKKQRQAIWIGVIFIVLMGLIPPWAQHHTSGSLRPREYAPLWEPPETFASHWVSREMDGSVTFHEGAPDSYSIRIDLARLLIQWVLVIALVGARVVTAKDRVSGDLDVQPL